MDDRILKKELNAEQYEAVTSIEGPLLVLAGAGSGKTRVITYRIANMVAAGGVDPATILAVTFTNKAAGEMKGRVGALLERFAPGVDGRDVWVSTFHSGCARILRRHAGQIGFTPDFLIYDDDDSKAVAKKVLASMDVPDDSLSAAELVLHIDRMKNLGYPPSEAASEFPDPVRAEGYARYQRRLRESNAMDFGDLMLNMVQLWKSDRAALDLWRQRFRYVLVDEFQDTNRVQLEFLLLLTGARKNICVVGDDDQSIYRWRGAEVKNILRFPEHFPGAKVVRLEQNYRSTQAILTAANTIVARNASRHPKKLWTRAGEGEPLTVYRAQDDRDEASFLASEIMSRRRKGGGEFDQFAVFVRTGAQSRAIEDRFREARIPYELVGGVRFYERREIKDVLAYLRLTVNPRSDVDFERIINVPPRGIGDVTVGKLRAAAQSAGLPLLEAARIAGGKFAPFVQLMDRLTAIAGNAPVSRVAREALDSTGYVEMLKFQSDPGAGERIENIEELVTGMMEFEEAAGEGEKSIGAFLEKAALTADIDRYEEKEGSVTVMTLHSAKGLEFPCVFITGCEEGLFPHARSFDDHDELEEERRLMYVGMTRARKKLYVTHAARRRWQGTYRDQIPSRFVREIPGAQVLGALPERQGRLGTGLFQEGSFAGGFGGGYGGRGHRVDRDDGTSVDYSEAHLHAERSAATDWRSEKRIVRRPGEGTAPAGSKGSIGKKVRHELFGVGVVMMSEGDGDQRKLVVRFPSAGLKKVLERFVKWVD